MERVARIGPDQVSGFRPGWLSDLTGEQNETEALSVACEQHHVARFAHVGALYGRKVVQAQPIAASQQCVVFLNSEPASGGGAEGLPGQVAAVFEVERRVTGPPEQGVEHFVADHHLMLEEVACDDDLIPGAPLDPEPHLLAL